MTETVNGSDSTSPGSSLMHRYGAAERFRVAYRAPQHATSQPADDRSGEVALSDSNPPDQDLSLPTIPASSSVTPPAAMGAVIDLTATIAGVGTLRADLTVVRSLAREKAERRERVRLPKIKRTDHIAQYRIAGEMFYVEVKSRRTYLRHPRWSLMGAGKTLAAAEVALLEEAGLVVRVFGKMPAAELDEEAERMLNFARRIA